MSSYATVGAHGRDVTAAEATSLAAPPPSKLGPTSFSDVLDALNPLQYLPIVGSIYRVATGDDGNPTLRTAVSLISGVLMGGPIGLLTSMAGEVFGHYFDFEHYARSVVAPSTKTAPTAAPAATTMAAAATAAAAPAVAAATPAPALAPTSAAPPVAATSAPPGMAKQAAAAYAQAAILGGHIIPGGAER